MDWAFGPIEILRPERSHSVRGNRQEILVFLKPGRFNLFWRFRKDKAEEEGEVGLFDLSQLDDWVLKRKLGIRK